MTILEKLHIRKREDVSNDAHEAESLCPHVSLLPRWDDPEAIGRDERAAYWICASCEQEFTPEEVLELRQTQHARLQQYVSNN